MLTPKKCYAEGFESVKSMRGIMKNMHRSRLVVPVVRGRGPHMNPKCSHTPYSAVNSLLHETEMITKGFRISYRILDFFF